MNYGELVLDFNGCVIPSDPPKFEPTQQTDFNGDEGQTLKIELSAFANPMTMTYVWSKDGALLDTKQRIISDGPNLIFSKLHRKDAGTYTCEAMNSQGTATFAIKVSVECKFPFPPSSQ